MSETARGERGPKWGRCRRRASFAARPPSRPLSGRGMPARRWKASAVFGSKRSMTTGFIGPLTRAEAHKYRPCERLVGRCRLWFGARFEFLLCGVTSASFAGLAHSDSKAARGSSGDKRGGCEQV